MSSSLLSPHGCEFPSLDYVEFGASWVCPFCGRRYIKTDDYDCTFWEEDEFGTSV